MISLFVYSEVIIFISGIIAGFFSSSPIGAINVLVAEFVMAKQTKRIPAFVLGVILFDVILAIFACLGYSQMIQTSSYHQWLQLVGGFLLVFIGFYWFFQNKTHQIELKKNWPASKDKTIDVFIFFRDFFYGLILCASNPAFFIFWLFVANQISGFISQDLTVIIFSIYALGIIIGDILWFFLFCKIAQKSFAILSFQGVKLIRRCFSFFMILCGLYSIGQHV